MNIIPTPLARGKIRGELAKVIAHQTVNSPARVVGDRAIRTTRGTFQRPATTARSSSAQTIVPVWG